MIPKKFILVALLFAGFPVIAQTRGAARISFGNGFASPQRYRPFPGSFYYGAPFLYDDYPAVSLASVPQTPQVIVVQATNAAPAQPEPSIDPLMIELRGNEYVRVGNASSRGETASAESEPIPAVASPPADRETASSAPAVLIYRDGHRELIADYAIIGGIMYAGGDYWRTGSWTKPIQLSALNLPATIQANERQGVKFILPSGPNQVVTRP
ncbi:MAG TPA: hypothetical protein VF753_09005 [Terriglobales bacterium]